MLWKHVGYASLPALSAMETTDFRQNQICYSESQLSLTLPSQSCPQGISVPARNDRTGFQATEKPQKCIVNVSKMVTCTQLGTEGSPIAPWGENLSPLLNLGPHQRHPHRSVEAGKTTSNIICARWTTCTWWLGGWWDDASFSLLHCWKSSRAQPCPHPAVQATSYILFPDIRLFTQEGFCACRCIKASWTPCPCQKVFYPRDLRIDLLFPAQFQDCCELGWVSVWDPPITGVVQLQIIAGHRDAFCSRLNLKSRVPGQRHAWWTWSGIFCQSGNPEPNLHQKGAKT